MVVLPVPATPITTTTWGVLIAWYLAVFVDLVRRRLLKPIRYDVFKSL